MDNNILKIIFRVVAVLLSLGAVSYTHLTLPTT